ncbi:MAG TPA: hypothetical protein VD838_13850, partial [Anaeromyxobacteraceae bacterium]|nr:hypothetical protein [Anaeromyxobacteraceae bacterium]
PAREIDLLEHAGALRKIRAGLERRFGHGGIMAEAGSSRQFCRIGAQPWGPTCSRERQSAAKPADIITA